MNTNADCDGSFTTLMLYRSASSERATHSTVEGGIIGNLYTAFTRIEAYIESEQLELIIDVRIA
jgi:hypothetical protein